MSKSLEIALEPFEELLQADYDKWLSSHVEGIMEAPIIVEAEGKLQRLKDRLMLLQYYLNSESDKKSIYAQDLRLSIDQVQARINERA